MKANGSRREEREEKISRKNQVRPPVGAERKTVGRRGAGRWAGGRRRGWGGGRCGAGRARAGGAAWCPRSRSLGRAAPLAPTPAAPRVRHVSASTLHVQSAQVSAPDRNRASAPAADLRAGTEPHAAQG